MESGSIRYWKKMGSHKLRFQGKPDDYYQLSCFDICSALLSCFAVVIFFFFFIVALFFWSKDISTSNLVLVCSIIICLFIPFLMIFAFIGSRNKMQIEQRLIKQALERIVERRSKRRHQLREQEQEVSRMPLRKEEIRLQLQ